MKICDSIYINPLLYVYGIAAAYDVYRRGGQASGAAVLTGLAPPPPREG